MTIDPQPPQSNAVQTLPEGRFSGREAFQQLVRDALATAAREGWREIILSGHRWPIYVRDLRTLDPAVLGAVAIEGQPGVVQSVNVWLASAEEE